MNKFPENLSFEESQKKLYADAPTCVEMNNLRKMMHESYEIAIQERFDNWSINFSNTPNIFKELIINELFEKFPHIGYIEETKLNDKIELKIKKIDKNNIIMANQYIIALTQNFADIIENCIRMY